MVPLKALIVCVPIAGAGALVVVDQTRQIGRLQEELAQIDEARKTAGESFLRTFQGEHVHREFAAFDRLRELAAALAEARRNRLLGALAIALAGLGLAGAWIFRRIARELEEDRRYLQGPGS
ncbi:MAG TPA: hypothetical protein VFR85_04115 [Anaeromyxobacteraceae bacterium]|nr:hypothetical protein [Anaeromyxobacteraceae bacterium]